MAEGTWSYSQLGGWYNQHAKVGPDGKPVYERGREDTQVEIPNPKYNPDLPPNAQLETRTIKIPAVKITGGDGAVVIVQEQPPDPADPNQKPTYLVHSHEDPPVPNAQTAGTIAERNGKTYIIKPDGGTVEVNLPADTKPQNQQIVLAADGKRYLVTVDANGKISTQDTGLPGEPKPNTQQLVNGGDGKKYLVTVDAAGNITTKDTGLPAEARPGTSQIVEAGDGKKYVVTVGADGKVTTTDTGLTVKGDVSHGHDEGGDYTITMGADGKPVKTYATVANAPKTAEPPGAPPLDFSPGKVTQSLMAYSNWVNSKVLSGELTPQAATALMTQKKQLADTAVSEASNAAQTAGSVYGHQVSERNADVNAAASRAATATSGYNQALQTIAAGAKAQPKGSSAAAGAFRELLAMQVEHAKNFGGGPVTDKTPIPAALAPYMTIQTRDGHTITLNQQGNPIGVDGRSAMPSQAPVSAPTPPPNTAAPTPVNTNPVTPVVPSMAPVVAAGQSPSQLATAAPAGQVPPHIAQMADSRPTGNAFADNEMTLTAAGISPAAIERARQLFLSMGQPPLQPSAMY